MNNTKVIGPRNKTIRIRFCVADDLDKDEDKEKLFDNLVYNSEIILLKNIENLLEKTSISSGLLAFNDRYYHLTCLRKFDAKNEYAITEILEEDVPKVINLISDPDFLINDINENTAVSMISDITDINIQ